MYIGNLPDNVYDTDIYQFFKHAGYQIGSSKVIFNKDTKQHEGFGYINFFTPEEAERCLREMNNAKLRNKQIILSHVRPKDSTFNADANIIVRNLPKELLQQDLMTLFSPFGRILSCKLETDSKGESKGFGYVQFENP